MIELANRAKVDIVAEATKTLKEVMSEGNFKVTEEEMFVKVTLIFTAISGTRSA